VIGDPSIFKLIRKATYDNFIQTTGIRDGVSHSAKVLSVFYDSLDTSDPDPDVIIKIDISNVFNTRIATTCRVFTLDVLSGRASRDYACGLKKGQDIRTCDTLGGSRFVFRTQRTGKFENL
jgi:hypothetical protein